MRTVIHKQIAFMENARARKVTVVTGLTVPVLVSDHTKTSSKIDFLSDPVNPSLC